MEVGTSQIFDLVGEVQALGDKSIAFDFSSSVLAFREFSDAACIDVKTHHWHASPSECCGNRQADIS
jgi:hypothetical protein